MKNNIKLYLSLFFLKLKQQNSTFLLILGAFMFMAISYTFIKLNDVPNRKISIEKGQETEKYKNGRILGNYIGSTYKKKDRLVSKKLNVITKGQKDILESFSKLSKRVEEMEKQKKQVKEDENEKNKKEGEKKEGERAEKVIFHNTTEKFKVEKVQDANKRKHLGKKNVNKRKRQVKRSIVSFPVKDKTRKKKLGIVLPSGSYVKAKLLTGVEVPEGKTYPVLAQLDYAFIAPSNTRIDLSGCFLILKSSGDLSTESVQFQATKLSCVSKKGMMFERKVNGFIADNKDSNFGVRGELLSKQGRVARMALVSSIVEKASSLISGAKSGTQKALASSSGDAASIVANWYLKQAQSLLPTIRVGSGQDIWVVMADKVNLPSEYFRKRRNGNESIYSYYSNILN